MPHFPECGKAAQYPLLSPCSCRKRCYDHVSEASRKEIHKTFWELDQSNRHLWIYNRIKNVQNKKLKKKPVSGKNRKHLRHYFLDVNCLVAGTVEMVNVCQKFFLSSIGYKNDHVISWTLEKQELQHLQPAKTPEVSPSSGAKTVLQRKLQNHPLLPPCSCKRRCAEKITQEHREMFRICYWSIGANERKKWLYACIQSNVPKRRCKVGKRRACSRQYYFTDARGQSIGVCQKFFLSTLGYTSDSIIIHTMGTMPNERNFGRNEENQLSFSTMQLLKQHIMEHARFFAKSSTRNLYADFVAKNGNLEFKPSFEYYEAVANVLNVKIRKEYNEISENTPEALPNWSTSSNYSSWPDFRYSGDQFNSDFRDANPSFIHPFASEFYELQNKSSNEGFDIEHHNRTSIKMRLDNPYIIKPEAEKASAHLVTADNLFIL